MDILDWPKVAKILDWPPLPYLLLFIISAQTYLLIRLVLFPNARKEKLNNDFYLKCISKQNK